MASPLAAGPMRSQGRSLLVCTSMSPGIWVHRACRADVLARRDGGMRACDAPFRDDLVPRIADRYPIGNSSFLEPARLAPPRTRMSRNRPLTGSGRAVSAMRLTHPRDRNADLGGARRAAAPPRGRVQPNGVGELRN